MMHWYLVHTKPRQENIALINLNAQAYSVYLPLIVTRRRSASGFIFVKEPMFPRYLFIELDDKTDNWSPIRSTRGVHTLVRFGELPSRVDEGLIAAIKQFEETQSDKPVPEFDTGQKVKIVDGVLAGYEAIFQQKTAANRVSVLLDMVGCQTQIDLSLDILEAV